MSFLLNVSIFKRNRNFTLLYIGQFISFLGTMMTGVALPYQIYTETRSTLMVGLLSLTQLIPLLFTALAGGVFADRYHRRLILLTIEPLLAIGGLLLAWNALLHKPHLDVIFMVAAIMSACVGMHRPARDSMVQQIIDKKDYPAVSSLGGVKASICMIGGPAIAGVLIAVFGVATVFFIDALTFFLSVLTLLMMKNILKPVSRREETVWTSLKKGLHYAWSRQELIGTYLVDFNAMVFGMPQALFPALAASMGGAKVLGMLYSAPAVGALILSFFSGWVVKVKRHGVAIAVAASLWGVAIIFFGLSSHLVLALLFLALAGAADAVSAIFRGIVWNETIPNELRGRLAGIEMISYLSGPKLGDTEAGLVAAAFGVTASIVSGGALCILGVGLCCYCFPKFWYYRSEIVEGK